jgi:pyruvate formate lyase activating enzyme
MDISIFKKGFNYAQDGPGNRLVIHMQGCNMRCPWCSNPEGMSLSGTFIVESEKLIPSVCPFGAIREGALDRAKCASCSERPCLYENKNEGIALSCVTVPTELLLKEAVSCVDLFFDGGGVTFSGGEPTLQFEALREILMKLKSEGVHTAIETNGTSPRLSELFPYLDLMIIDFKHYDPVIHERVTGVKNDVIQMNIERAVREHGNVWVRTPLIGEFNGQERFIQGFAEHALSLPADIAQFEFLRYHEYGRIKWDKCGLSYTMCDGEVPVESRDAFEDAFKALGLKVIRT